MPTRQFQQDFENSLKTAFAKDEIINSISNIILKTVETHFVAKFEEYERRIKKLENEINILKTSNDSNKITLEKEINVEKQIELEQKLDNIQQIQKNKNVRFLHVPETENEMIEEKIFNIINEKMGVGITKSQITTIYRVGQKIDNGKPRHVIVTFPDTNIKMKVFKKKSLLKGSKFILKEDLTLSRLTVMKTASEKYGFKNVWSMNGTIFAKTENGVKKVSLY